VSLTATGLARKLPDPRTSVCARFTGFGIGFRQAGGDPAALMKLSVEHKVRLAGRLSACLPLS
jgi:hypothetical protein